MQQLSQNLRTGRLNVSDTPLPSVQAGQVLVKSAYSLISAGTERTKIETGKMSLVGKALSRPDQVRQVLQSVQQAGLQNTFQKVKTRLDARSPLGYSAAGVVFEVGPGVTEFRPGDRVACAGASAAHAEVISVPVNLCVQVPAEVNLDEAAFTTLGAIAMQGVRQADVRLGEVVVVIGLGLLGALTVQLLRAAGCAVLGFDPNVERCKLAADLGAQVAVTSESALRSQLSILTSTQGADAVLITAGTKSNRPVEFAGEISREKGRVVVVGAVGLTIPRAPYYDKEVDFRISRSYGPGRYDPAYEEKGIDYPYGYVRWTEKRNMLAFLNLVADGKVNLQKLITHRFGIDQADDAYDLISGKISEPYLGVLFEYKAENVSFSKVIQIPQSSRANNEKLGIGVIGAGNFAQSMLLPHLKGCEKVKFVSVSTRTPLHTRDAAERFGFELAVSSQQEIFQDPNVNAVIIATRHDSHAELVIQALRSGKAIHVEKPLALTRQELQEIQDAYDDVANPFVMVGFNRRFAPLTQKTIEFFCDRTEPLSMLYRINAGFIPSDHWTQDPDQGGGRIIGEVCHFIDYLQFMAKSSIISVHACATPNSGKYNNDNVTISLNFLDGSIGTVLYTANGDKAFPKEYIELYCQGRVAVIDDFKSINLISGGKKKAIRLSGQDKGHKNEMLGWAEALSEGKPEPIPFSESLLATKATFAALESIAKHSVITIE